MKRKPIIDDDPVVEEVRAWRQQLWKQAGGTFEGLRALLDRILPQKSAKKRISNSRANGRGTAKKRSSIK